MTRKLPPWAQDLLDTHPEGARPSPADPMPAWLESELARVPLWARIRQTPEIRQHHPFLLIEDLRKQPELMRQVLELRSELAALAHRLIDQGIRHLVFTGCGSAFHSSQFGSFICRKWCGWTTESHDSLEFTHHWTETREPTAVVVQSATGSTAETVDAARHAAAHGLLTVALTNTAGSALEELCDETICFPTGQRCGPAVSVLTTRLMMLYVLALEVGAATGALGVHEADELAHAIAQLPDAAAEFLREEDLNVAQIANALNDQQALLLVGGGPNWFSAREGALKVEEESSLLCKAYRPAGYLHNAIPVLSDTVGTVVIAPPGKAHGRLHDVVRTARAARSPSLAVVVEGDDAIAPDASFVIAVPGPLDELLMPPLAAVVFQLLGYYLAAERGINPDSLRSDDLDHARAWLTAFPFGSQ